MSRKPRPRAEGRLCGLAAACVACSPIVDLGEAELAPSAETTTGGASGTRALDVLFVIDNSASMAHAQHKLAAGIAEFVAALDELGFAWRIGFTTTDNGHFWCLGTSPELGALQLSSCRARLRKFVDDNNDVQDLACRSICALDSLAIAPTSIEGDPVARPRPWLEPDNVREGSLAEVLPCALPQGVDGCDFEQPLEALRRALVLTHTSAAESFGFMRDHAHFAVIFVTDEADCSTNEVHEPAVFSAVGAKAFWEDPSAEVPSSATCWNAGVRCEGGPGAYVDCFAEDYASDGSLAPKPADAVLVPVSEYEAMLADVRRNKNEFGAEVFVFAITGVPDEIPFSGVTYRESDDEFAGNHGIGPGCESAAGKAVPPVRLRALAETYATEGGRERVGLFSVCSEDYGPIYGRIAETIAGLRASG